MSTDIETVSNGVNPALIAKAAYPIPIGIYPNVIGIPNLKPCTNFSFLVIQNTSIK
jgi:hypothetical protein